MTLIALEQVSLSYSDRPLLDGASFSLQEGERVCLVGRNGAGKSTLLRIFAGRVVPDSGSVVFQSGITTGMLEQDPPRGLEGPVWLYVLDIVPDLAGLFRSYDAALLEGDTARAAELHHQIESLDGFTLKSRAENLLERGGLPPEEGMADLSGGQLRRAALIRATLREPNVLLLDEPTNHLDVESMESLRDYLLSFRGAVVFISHDRRFTDEVATRIAELDRGEIFSYPGNYRRYLEGRDLRRELEEKANRAFDRKLSEEEIWIRQGIKARRTRNEGRVRDLKRMREERRHRRNLQGGVRFTLSEAERTGNIVFEGDRICCELPDRCLIRDLNVSVRRGDKIALSGRNGCGKTTLLRILMGLQKPTSGKIRQGTGLEIAYFDQYRETLDEDRSVLDNLNGGRTEVIIGGKKRSVMGYLQDFLFEPRRVRSPVSALSGGEKNRLLLARLFLREFNVLILDEPTNDLDVETLELLEELLVSYQGTLILVSHDRWFIDNVATEIWHFGANGHIDQVIGGYADLERYLAGRKQDSRSGQDSRGGRKSASESRGGGASGSGAGAGGDQSSRSVTGSGSTAGSVSGAETCPSSQPRRLTFREQKELDELPEKIATLEGELEEAQQKMADPAFYAGDPGEIRKLGIRVTELEASVAAAYERWEQLETMSREYEEHRKAAAAR